MQSSGILLINKPIGLTSFDVIRRLRKITKIRKIGHTGTLDPFAEGLLPVCVGKATRVAGKISNNNKQYLVKMKLGEKTDSGDNTGQLIEKAQVPRLEFSQIKNIVPEILKINKQIPPIHSAKKINGKRAYEYARKNQRIDLKPKDIEILDFTFINYDTPFLIYRATVSKGTYIRVLSETIAEILGTIGFTDQLQRTKVGKLLIEDSVDLNKLSEDNWKQSLFDVSKILKDFPKISLNSLDYFTNGRKISVEHEDISDIMVMYNNRCVGFAKIKNNTLYPKKVMIE